MAFFEARRQGFSLGASVSSPPSSVNGFRQESNTKIDAILTL